MNQQEIFTYIQKQYPTHPKEQLSWRLLKNADYMIDMGPGGGDAGETIVAAGTPEDIVASEQSITEKYLKTERG